MGWTPIYLKTDDLNVLILGAGEVGTRRALRFKHSGANVIIIGASENNTLKKEEIKFETMDNLEKLINWSDIVITASGDLESNKYLASLSEKKLINRSDSPFDGNIIIPTTFELGDVQLSIFTKTKSPLMAKEIRKKIESSITSENLLLIELQEYSRSKLKKLVSEQKTRKEILYKIANDNKISYYLKNNELELAKNHADIIIKEALI